jgi:hypothetical protein
VNLRVTTEQDPAEVDKTGLHNQLATSMALTLFSYFFANQRRDADETTLAAQFQYMPGGIGLTDGRH